MYIPENRIEEKMIHKYSKQVRTVVKIKLLRFIKNVRGYYALLFEFVSSLFLSLCICDVLLILMLKNITNPFLKHIIRNSS